MGQPSTFECLGGVHFISICVSRNGTSCQTLEDQLAQEYADKTPEARLKRLLSVRTVVSTASSFAERQQAAMGVLVDFREIGTGSIGKVFEHPGTVFAYKLPLLDDSAKLWNNYIVGMRVEASFHAMPHYSGQVGIPRCFWFAVPQTEAFFGTRTFIDFPTLSSSRASLATFCAWSESFPFPSPPGRL